MRAAARARQRSARIRRAAPSTASSIAARRARAHSSTAPKAPCTASSDAPPAREFPAVE